MNLAFNNKILTETKRLFIADFDGKDILMNCLSNINIDDKNTIFYSVSTGLWYGESFLTKGRSRFWSDNKMYKKKDDDFTTSDFIETFKKNNI